MSKDKKTVIRNLNKALKEFDSKNKENTYQNYIFVILFYRYLSIDIVNYVKNKYNKNYEKLSNTEAEELKNEIISDKDYFILPSELFQNVIKERQDDPYLDSVINSIFNKIRKSSKYDICDIFKNIDVEDEKLGHSNEERSQALSVALKSIGNIKYDFEDSEFDLFGLVYELLLNKYDDNLKISLGNGVYYTQSTLVKLLIEISQLYVSNPKNVYDPTCGSGSLLVEYSKFNNKISFYGQELLSVPYSLCKMNMILHGVKDYHITNADTLLTYNKSDKEKYELILSNPPFSVSWNTPSIDDERFNNIPVLPPKNYADYAFIYHILYTLNQNGVALVINGPAMLSRTLKGNDETSIREHLVKENVIDTIIQLPNNFFLRTSIGACLFILRKNKTDKNILFIDATTLYTTSGHTKTFNDANVENIIDIIKRRENIDDLSYLATPEEIANNNYIFSVESYINYEMKTAFKPVEPSISSPYFSEEMEYETLYLHKSFNQFLIEAKINIIPEINEKLINTNDIKMVKLNDLAVSIKSGTKLTQIGAISKDDLPYYYITSKEIENGTIIPISTIKSGDGRDIKGTQKINKEALNELLRLSNLEKDDILFTLSETGPKVAVVNRTDFGFNHSIYVLKPKKDKINPLFLRYILESDYMKEQISNKLSHANAKSIKIEEFRNLTIPDIPLKIQNEIVSYLKVLEDYQEKIMLDFQFKQSTYNKACYELKNILFKNFPKEQRKEK